MSLVGNFFGSDVKKTENKQLVAQQKDVEISKEERITQLKKEISGIDTFKSSIQTGSIDALVIEIAYFKILADMVRSGLFFNDPEINQSAKNLQIKLKNLQQTEFPRMRKEYTTLIGQKLWEQNIYVQVSGNKNQIIEFIGGVFASNKNISDTETALEEMLKELRFDEARYRWYRSASEYTHYDLKSLSDSDVN
jgi:hypothetical protein